MDTLKLCAWALLNVGVPLLWPLALIPLLGASRQHAGKVKVLIMAALQDGQLLWTVIAMCAAASYEAAMQMDTSSNPAAQARAATSWLVILWHVLIMVGASVLVLLGAMDAKGANRGRRSPRIMSVSVWLSAITAVSYIAVHTWATWR